MIIRITASKPHEAVRVRSMRLQIPTRPLRILDFDCEARPLSWISSDYVSKEITAIAWKWIDEDSPVQCVALTLRGNHLKMLKMFRAAYDQADMVTGHYIRGYDLPLINGMLMEYGLPPLSNKLAQDTKIDLVPRASVSMSRKALERCIGWNIPK